MAQTQPSSAPPAALVARLRAIGAGASAERVASLLAARRERPTIATLASRRTTAGYTLLEWTYEPSGRRGAVVILGDTPALIRGLFNSDEEIQGDLDVTGDAMRSVANVFAGGRPIEALRIRNGAVVSWVGPDDRNSYPLVATPCGVVEFAPFPVEYDPATLRPREGSRCAGAFTAIRAAVHEHHTSVRGAYRALDALAPVVRGEGGPGVLVPGANHQCVRPDASAKARALRMIQSARGRDAQGQSVEPPAGLTLADDDFGCVNPRTRAFLVRARATNPRSDAVFVVQPRGVRALQAWGVSEVRRWIDVDLQRSRV